MSLDVLLLLSVGYPMSSEAVNFCDDNSATAAVSFQIAYEKHWNAFSSVAMHQWIPVYFFDESARLHIYEDYQQLLRHKVGSLVRCATKRL